MDRRGAAADERRVLLSLTPAGQALREQAEAVPRSVACATACELDEIAQVLRTVVAASSAGTTFEWYDFFVFGSLTQVISKTFFSGLTDTAGYIAALALFGAGFAFRPLGALVFGRIGDKAGRKGDR